MRSPGASLRGLGLVARAGIVLCLLGGAASADTIKLSAQLAPVVDTVKSGKGTATLSLDTAAKTVSWSIDYSGIKAPASGAFMVPGAKPSDDPTPLMLTLPASTTSPIAGSMPLSDAQIAGIQSGNWWIMLGSKDGPEIGGQIKKAP